MYFPNDPLLGLRPDLQFGARGRAPAPAGGLRHGSDPARMGARLPLRHRAARPQRHADGIEPMSDGLTPSQTIGPFYWGTIVNAYRADLAPPASPASASSSCCTLHDVEGAIVPDGLLEIWQANSHGRYNHPDDRRNLPLDAGFEGFGRASTDTDGLRRFTTVQARPRAVARQGGLQAPHINISIFARGVLNRLATRLYFDGDPALRRGSGAEDDRAGAPRHADRQARRQGRVAPADPSRRAHGNRLLRRLIRWPAAWSTRSAPRRSPPRPSPISPRCATCCASRRHWRRPPPRPG